MNLAGYDGILFDLDDTLMDHTGASIKGLDSWCQELGLPTGQYQRWAEIEIKWVSRYERGDLSHPQQRRERAKEFTGQLHLTDEQATKLYDGFIRGYQAHWAAFDNAIPTIHTALAAGKKVGILTNGAREMQEGKVRAGDLVIDGVELIPLVEYDAPKPRPGAYSLGCEIIGTAPERTVMIGDNWLNDVEAPRQAGLKGVYFYQGLANQPKPQPADQEVITSLSQLVFSA